MQNTEITREIRADRYLKISEENLKMKVLENQTLAGSILQFSHYEKVVFSHCEFYACEFTGIVFDNCIFENCKIEFSHFKYCHFLNCSFVNCTWTASSTPESQFHSEVA